ncbi:MAG TPA: copper chaperone PCu(A)C [Xanthobacteraceae bacterium]|nr:copper chaperone PCu(A)C [Xanthobacteraceae bacterium]
MMRMVKQFLLLILLAMPSATMAQQVYTKGNIEIQSPWSRATPAGADVGASYLVITNKGTQSDRLVSFTTDLAGQPEIHEMGMDGGVMKMRPLPKGLEIPPGATIKLQPGGYHLMLLKLKKPLTQGQRYKATLVFEKAGPIEVEFEVRAIGGNNPGGHKHNH